VGDEIVNIDGKRLRGLRLERARHLLAACRNVVDAVVSRTAPAGPPELTTASAAAAAANQQQQDNGDLINLASFVAGGEEEVVRPTIITIGAEEVDEVEEKEEEGQLGDNSGRTVELVHTTVDTPQVCYRKVYSTYLKGYQDKIFLSLGFSANQLHMRRLLRGLDALNCFSRRFSKRTRNNVI
jgi:hypothetical protein